ncbi:dihydroxyacetone kinase DhaM subunit [Carnobacterium iners]|uniref:phosphoenolpyruvate--glycerone phosphotransferase n=1 Tax=Carnobacterium iners TaxID=1073423 RepID=A0A1X7MR66_9LACT|nr:dihydroxyacetone kinase DhaM subunit [Carnobacterium iners]SMH27339.1 dihydroxyacetone kinase DhaM subunit [Carnobacterium iners]
MFTITREYAVLLISHVEDLANGVATLLNEIAADVTIKTAGGTSQGTVGTSFDKINDRLESFEEETILAFYDLGSAKMNLELASEISDKNILVYDTAFVEGAYTAAALLQAKAPLKAIEEQLIPLKIK